MTGQALAPYNNKNRVGLGRATLRVGALAAALALVLAACGAEEDDPTSVPEGGDEEAEAPDEAEGEAPDEAEGEAAEAGYPTRPIEMIVPYSAGGGTDVIARAYSSVASKFMDVPIRVVAMPGGGGSLGAEHVANSEPDGYTLIFGASGSQLTTPLIDDVGYAWDDFDPIATITELPFVIIVNADSEFQTMEDLIDASKESPGEISYASSGAASSSQVNAVLMAETLGVEWNHIPFDGGAEALVALRGGHVDFGPDALGSAMPAITEGDVRALAVTSAERDDLIPDVPTLNELGYEHEFGAWRAIEAPTGTPDEVIDYMVGITEQVMEDEDFRDIVLALEPMRYRTPDEFRSLKEDWVANLEPQLDKFR